MSSIKKKIIALTSMLYSSLFASNEKSAIVFYGTDISYSKVQNNDYIIVQSNHIDTADAEFFSNRDNMYAYVSVCEI